mmetsp:Transcript_76199/g.204593  ORF Transcript_76199/g.204593 Transcript_76199/m.204593 type:complete len:242 (+) Transcript_76199:104-829(+)
MGWGLGRETKCFVKQGLDPQQQKPRDCARWHTALLLASTLLQCWLAYGDPEHEICLKSMCNAFVCRGSVLAKTTGKTPVSLSGWQDAGKMGTHRCGAKSSPQPHGREAGRSQRGVGLVDEPLLGLQLDAQVPCPPHLLRQLLLVVRPLVLGPSEQLHRGLPGQLGQDLPLQLGPHTPDAAGIQGLSSSQLCSQIPQLSLSHLQPVNPRILLPVLVCCGCGNSCSHCGRVRLGSGVILGERH